MQKSVSILCLTSILIRRRWWFSSMQVVVKLKDEYSYTFDTDQRQDVNPLVLKKSFFQIKPRQKNCLPDGVHLNAWINHGSFISPKCTFYNLSRHKCVHYRILWVHDGYVFYYFKQNVSILSSIILTFHMVSLCLTSFTVFKQMAMFSNRPTTIWTTFYLRPISFSIKDK